MDVAVPEVQAGAVVPAEHQAAPDVPGVPGGRVYQEDFLQDFFACRLAFGSPYSFSLLRVSPSWSYFVCLHCDFYA